MARDRSQHLIVGRFKRLVRHREERIQEEERVPVPIDDDDRMVRTSSGTRRAQDSMRALRPWRNSRDPARAEHHHDDLCRLSDRSTDLVQACATDGQVLPSDSGDGEEGWIVEPMPPKSRVLMKRILKCRGVGRPPLEQRGR